MTVYPRIPPNQTLFKVAGNSVIAPFFFVRSAFVSIKINITK